MSYIPNKITKLDLSSDMNLNRSQLNLVYDDDFSKLFFLPNALGTGLTFKIKNISLYHIIIFASDVDVIDDLDFIKLFNNDCFLIQDYNVGKWIIIS